MARDTGTNGKSENAQDDRPGFITGLFSVYGGLALRLEDTRQKTVLPMFGRGRARQSIEGGLQDQLDRIEREAGVRQQLEALSCRHRGAQAAKVPGAARRYIRVGLN